VTKSGYEVLTLAPSENTYWIMLWKIRAKSSQNNWSTV